MVAGSPRVDVRPGREKVYFFFPDLNPTFFGPFRLRIANRVPPMVRHNLFYNGSGPAPGRCSPPPRPPWSSGPANCPGRNCRACPGVPPAPHTPPLRLRNDHIRSLTSPPNRIPTPDYGLVFAGPWGRPPWGTSNHWKVHNFPFPPGPGRFFFSKQCEACPPNPRVPFFPSKVPPPFSRPPPSPPTPRRVPELEKSLFFKIGFPQRPPLIHRGKVTSDKHGFFPSPAPAPPPWAISNPPLPDVASAPGKPSRRSFNPRCPVPSGQGRSSTPLPRFFLFVAPPLPADLGAWGGWFTATLFPARTGPSPPSFGPGFRTHGNRFSKIRFFGPMGWG